MCPGVRFIPHTVLERPGGKMESLKYIFISSSLKKKLNDNMLYFYLPIDLLSFFLSINAYVI